MSRIAKLSRGDLWMSIISTDICTHFRRTNTYFSLSVNALHSHIGTMSKQYHHFIVCSNLLQEISAISLQSRTVPRYPNFHKCSHIWNSIIMISPSKSILRSRPPWDSKRNLADGARLICSLDHDSRIN